MLLRRKIRKDLLGERVLGTLLTPQNVESHVNGSVTVVVRAAHGAVNYTPEHLESGVRELLAGMGHENLPTLRKGYTQGGRTLVVTLTSRAMVREAELRYGGTPLTHFIDRLEAALAEAEGPVQVEVPVMVVGEDGAEEYQWPVVVLPELEPSEV